ncbi:MFS transporter [Nocardiopsis sp. JB363]|uniref:MFS transporter n=1 Tax=Nocardiopsis sp. JB363 TaxID=1434837 RepID=UPI0021010998|nr:MFS transporter [Nocardiopsis sp. JB363]
MGGALGPYGSTMVTPILHEVAQGLDSTPELAASAVTAYMVPFAALMLVSGTLAERWGRRRTIQVSLTVFVLACALCAFSPTMELFLASRVLQGATNAFTTPLLIAAITDSVPHDRLGRSMGWFAAWQAMGQAFSPLISGVAGFVDWRLSFVAPALCAMALILLPPDESVTGRRATGRASWSSLLNRRLALACALAFLCYLAAVGLTVLSALRAEDVFGLGPLARGLVASSFGIAGLLLADFVGRALDRLGPITLGLIANTVLAVGLVTAALGPSVAAMTVGVIAVGASVTAMRATVNSVAATSTADNRAGATSLALSFQFFGGALAAVVWVPLYDLAPGAGFAATALAPLLAILLLVAVWGGAGIRGPLGSRAESPISPKTP